MSMWFRRYKQVMGISASKDLQPLTCFCCKGMFVTFWLYVNTRLLGHIFNLKVSVCWLLSGILLRSFGWPSSLVIKFWRHMFYPSPVFESKNG